MPRRLLDGLDLHEWAARHRRTESVRGHGESWVASDREYAERYLRPVVGLLGGWLRHGRAEYAEVYLDERLRFVPLDGDRDAALEDLRRMTAGDQAAIVAAVAADRRAEVASRLDALHAPLFAPTPPTSTDVLLVGDCLMTEIKASMAERARREGIDLRLSHVYFSVAEGVDLSTDAVLRHLQAHPASVVGLSFLTFSGIPPYTALLERADHLDDDELAAQVDGIAGLVGHYVDQIREHSDVPLVLHGACGLPLTRWRKRVPLLAPMTPARQRVVDRLDHALRHLAEATDNVIFLDEAGIIAGAGYRKASRPLVARSITRGAVFHTSRAGRELAREYADIVDARTRLAGVKVLLVDFDNTLWRGVMAEGPVEHDREAQTLLRQLREAGILLVAVSKNDPAAIRWDEMALTEDDFVLLEIGWRPKPDAVRDAATRLDLGLSSFVLLDDNPVERAMVTETLPEVRALDPGEPPTWRALRWLLEFPETRRTEEAARRTAMYREGVARKNALSGPQDYSALLHRLALEVDVRPGSKRDLHRIHELVSRTNQFNTTTRRRSQPELRTLLDAEDVDLLTFSLRDRYGDLGIVGLTVCERRAGEVLVDAVVMSCRAMGFGLERLMVREAMGRAGDPCDHVGLFEPTPRNGPAADLFGQCGFVRDESGAWRWRPDRGLPDVPPWLSVHRGS